MTDRSGPGSSLRDMADLVTPMALRVAATLRIADHLARGPMAGPELAGAVDADADVLERVLHHLVGVRVLSRDSSGRYALTALGDELRDDHPAALRPTWAMDTAIGRADLSFVHLLHSVRTGEAAFPEQFGRPFWDDLAADPGRTASYDARMGSDAAAWARAVVPAYDWGSLGHVVDVGGGNGTLLAALLHAHPTLRGTVFEQPATARAARGILTERGLGERSDVVSGSFFDPLPPGAGGYLLCAILHDWDDAAARAILRRCAEAAGATGSVFVIERTGADGESPDTGMDLRMLAYFGGRERGVTDLTTLAAGSGLRTASVHHAERNLAVLELTAA